jgi:uncharacterized membrane protein
MSGVPRRYWVLLAISVALNMFCLGVFVARSSDVRSRMFRGDMPERAFLRRSGLDEASPDVRALVKERRAHVREKWRAMAEARNEARRALDAEPFDAARFQTALTQVRERNAQLQEDLHGALDEVAGKLDHKQRKRLAEALWRGRGKSGHMQRGW